MWGGCGGGGERESKKDVSSERQYVQEARGGGLPIRKSCFYKSQKGGKGLSDVVNLRK